MPSPVNPQAWPMVFEQVLLATSVLHSMVFFANVRRPQSKLRTLAKTNATASLALFAAHRDGVGALPLALALGSLGDYFLAIRDTDENFLRGLGSFLLAHLLYIKMLLDKTSGPTLLFSQSHRLLALSAMSLLAPGINYLIISRIVPGLRIPVVVYSVVIFGMFAAALCVEEPQVTSGAILFTLSDSILATDRFLLSPESKHAAWMQYAVWALYYMGQLLLALGLSA